MAAATVVKTYQDDVIGNRRMRNVILTGVDTNTYDLGWNTIINVLPAPGTITGYTVAGLNPTGSRITFAASGAFTALPITIIGS